LHARQRIEASGESFEQKSFEQKASKKNSSLTGVSRPQKLPDHKSRHFHLVLHKVERDIIVAI